MCDPVSLSIAVAATAAASTTLGFVGQKQAYDANEKLANLKYATDADALSQQRSQIDAQQSESTFSSLIDRAKAQGAISASASSFGLGGATADRLSNAADFEAGRSIGITQLNAQSQRVQSVFQQRGAQIEQANKIASVHNPSGMELVLGLGKAALQGGNTYQGFKSAGQPK